MRQALVAVQLVRRGSRRQHRHGARGGRSPAHAHSRRSGGRGQRRRRPDRRVMQLLVWNGCMLIVHRRRLQRRLRCCNKKRDTRVPTTCSTVFNWRCFPSPSLPHFQGSHFSTTTSTASTFGFSFVVYSHLYTFSFSGFPWVGLIFQGQRAVGTLSSRQTDSAFWNMQTNGNLRFLEKHAELKSKNSFGPSQHLQLRRILLL